ncbi:MAG TPA: TonB-dependent receptor [Opitutaceae bacterium]|nr:TonB-dependent receptor [Opitutaceae bacterium]
MSSPTRLFIRRTSRFAFWIFVSGAWSAFVNPAAAASESAWISARVVDASSGEFLRGALVQVEGTTIQAVSDLQGTAVLAGVPAGHQSLLVTYLGTPALHQPVDLVAGQHAAVTLNMKPRDQVVTMSKLVVESLREGQAKALNQQKTSDTFVNIIGADSIGRFPDPNTAEALQRVVGISLERDTGEGRYINVRGVTSEYNAVTSDGETVLSNDSGDRRVNLNVIPASQVSQVEVVKSKTPDMQGDGIGGTVNLVSKSAFDTDHRIFEGTVAAGRLTDHNNDIIDTALTAGAQFGERRQFGVLVTGEYSRVPREFNDIEQGYDTQPVSGVPTLVSTNYALQGYLNVLTHRSVSMNLDARPDANNRYFVHLSYNRYDDKRTKHAYTTNFGKGTGFSAGPNPGDVWVKGATVQSALTDGLTVQRLANVNAGGKNFIGASELDYSAAYGYGSQTNPYYYGVTFARPTGVDEYYNRTNYNFPAFGPTAGADPYDPNLSLISKFTDTLTPSTDKQYSGMVNLKIPANLGAGKGFFKFGARLADRTKNSESPITYTLNFKGTPLAATTLAQLAEAEPPPFLYRARYQLGPFENVGLSRAFYAANANFVTAARGDKSYFNAVEDIYAAYGLYTVDLGRAHLVSGVRVESTRTDFQYFTFPATGGQILATPRKDYTDAFPSVHLRYDVSREFVLRAGFSTSIVRPQFAAASGSQSVNDLARTVSGGNPDLKPTYSYDFDASAEYYMPSLGLVSVGVFYKDIKDYIFKRSFVLVGGPYDGYRFSGSENVPQSHVAGLELNYNQQFTSLPGFLGGFGIYANATLTASRAEVRPGESTDLPKQADKIMNLALFYERHGLTARLALTHTAPFLYSVGSSATAPGSADTFYDKSTQLDFTASYALSQQYTIFCDALNLTNQPLRFYEAVTTRPIQQEYYGLRTDVGVKFRF